MLKRAFYAGERDDELTVRLVQPGSMTKVAGALPVVDEFISRLRPDPKYMFTLVNAMGYSEYFGPNSNTDWYGHNEHLDFNGLLHAPENCEQHGEFEGWRTDPTVQARLAKSWPFGFPSFYGATVYAHHKNTDPATLGFGDVIFATENDPMKRIELVMRIDVELAAKRGHSAILDRVHRGDRVDVSMGCKVPFDFCSICTDWEAVKKAWKGYDRKRHPHPGTAILVYHKTVKPIRGLAITKADYCEHMLHSRSKVLHDGRKVFVFNDFPRFFDISVVWVGADKTARVMWFLSSGKQPKGKAPPSLDDFMKGASDMTKVASEEPRKAGPGRLLTRDDLRAASEKKSEMEKEIRGGLMRKVDLCANSEVDLPFGVMAPFSKMFGLKTLLSTLAGLGVALRPGEFHMLVGMERPAHAPIAKMAHEAGVTFKTSMPVGLSSEYMVSGADFNAKLAAELMPYVAERSAFAPHLSVRLGQMDTMMKTAQRVAPKQAMEGLFVSKVAALYNGYRASLLAEADTLFPRYFEVEPPCTSDLVKSASSGTLLLSSPSVVHWISAHLEKVADVEDEVGAAVNYVLTDRDFSKLSALGVGVCASLSRGGNFISAVKSAVRTAL
jgi:hypothetical protein